MFEYSTAFHNRWQYKSPKQDVRIPCDAQLYHLSIKTTNQQAVVPILLHRIVVEVIRLNSPATDAYVDCTQQIQLEFLWPLRYDRVQLTSAESLESIYGSENECLTTHLKCFVIWIFTWEWISAKLLEAIWPCKCATNWWRNWQDPVK